MNIRLKFLISKKEQSNRAAQGAGVLSAQKPKPLDRVEFYFCEVCGGAVPKIAESCLVCKPASQSRLKNQ